MRADQEKSSIFRDDGNADEESMKAFIERKRELSDELADVLLHYQKLNRYTEFIVTPEMVDSNTFAI